MRAVQAVVEEGLALPNLIGRPSVIEQRIARLGLWIKEGTHFEITNIDSDPRYNDYWQHYHAKMERRGVSPSAAKAILRSRATAIGSVMVDRGEADALICGVVGRYHGKLKYILDIIGLEEGVSCAAAMSAVACDKGTYFFTDTHAFKQL